MSLEEVKRAVPDLHDLADRLGLKRSGHIKAGNALYYRPGKVNESNPSLSIFDGGAKWKDFAEDQGGSSPIDFVIYAENMAPDDWRSAADRIRDLYGIPWQPPARDPAAPRVERSREQYIADQCLAEADKAIDYLRKRGIPEETARLAIRRRSVGYNVWTKPGSEPGSFGHGGPALATIVREWHTDQPAAVDFRYIDPDLNGGVKTKTIGEKAGVPWYMCKRHVQAAHTLVIVESAINALCVEAMRKPGWAAVAIRGTGNASNIDWHFAIGKHVILAMDADLPDAKGNRPGHQAAWELYDRLTALNIACQLVDHSSWYEDGYNDIGDIAEKQGITEVEHRLMQLEPWAIAGMPGRDGPAGRSRVYLPAHDYAVYWRFRTRADFTSYVAKVEDSDEENGGEKLTFADVCGFRVAAISRVSVQSATATMSGEDDAQPVTLFAASVQVPRHGPRLLRNVLPDERLHNVDQWKKFGPVYQPASFSRLLNILERTAHLGARDAVNYVGLCWRKGQLAVNEGPDCYFGEPEKQCPYHNLTFPSGPISDAKRVIEAYGSTFRDNAALNLLVWSLGAHLKVVMGFWPHMILQANKGSGKSTLVKRLERTIGFQMFGGQSLGTEFRLLTSVSHTSHPVGWEELSARKQEIIDKAAAMLQESYQYTVTRRGSEMTEFLVCAPVLLAGEDVPVKTLTGKVVRTDLSGRMGPMMPRDLPRFPIRQWLEYLTRIDVAGVMEDHDRAIAWMWSGCRASQDDDGAKRMVTNYAAMAVGWKLLCDFAGIAAETDDYLRTLRSEMNAHIAETRADREPFVWILEMLASEIEAARFVYPHQFDVVNGEDCLILRPSHVMAHMSTEPRLREPWNALPVKSDRVFKKQLLAAGLIVTDDLDRVINHRRHAHLSALSLAKMAEYGVHLSQPQPAVVGEGSRTNIARSGPWGI